jgi:hypothetical protein
MILAKTSTKPSVLKVFDAVFAIAIQNDFVSFDLKVLRRQRINPVQTALEVVNLIALIAEEEVVVLVGYAFVVRSHSR